jgi:tRNA/rRNA methyltransferase
MNMSLHNCRVVLVRTEIAGNIGAAARVMRNLGLSQLVLVAPVADPTDKQAKQLSTHGQMILDRARVVASLEEALADCILVVGTSGRVGGPFRRQSVGLPEEVLPIVAETSVSGPTALVFGPEPSGLTNTEVTLCHHLIHVPTDPEYQALNLAQAVAICLYELRKAWLKQTAALPAREPAASYAAQDRMFAHLRTALECVHYLWDENADTLMHALRHLIGRAQPTPMEVNLLHGLARQLLWLARQPHHQDDDTSPEAS